MTKANITQYDNTAANNTDVQDVPLGENAMYPSHVNNAFREIMADLADVNDGTVTLTSPAAGSINITGNITVGGTVDGRDVATDGSKLDGVEASADVTDTANVAAAGAAMLTGATFTGSITAPDATFNGTTAVKLPAGTDAQRPTGVNGMLRYNSDDAQFEGYADGAWGAIAGGGETSFLLYSYTATSGQTTFSGSDDNSATLSYTASNIIVTLNGITLENGTDYTASNGTSIVLTVGAAAGDELNVIAFKSFTTADMVSATTGGTFNGNVAVNGTLDVNGNELILDADGDTSITADTDDQIDFKTGGTDRVTIDSSGNVGIGTTSPQLPLHVKGGFPTSVIERDAGTGGAAGLIFTNSTTNGIYLTGSDTTFTVGHVSDYEGSPSYTERMRIDSSGRVLVGKTSTSFPSNGVELGTSVDANGWALWATGTPTSNGGVIAVNRKSSDGIFINVYKDSTNVGSIGTSGDLLYMASTSGAGFRLVNDDLRPATASGGNRDNALDLGHSSVRWDDVYATNGAIQTSDRNEKQQIASLTAAEITAAKAISKLFKTFKWNDKVEAKGDAARTHTGVIAQDVQQAMTDAGLDAGDYAFFISTTWWETQTEVPAVEADEENGIEAQDAYTRTDTYETAEEAPEGATKRTRLGIRYPELLAFIGAATEQRLADIETRLTALEAN